jgi:hypothetical protein
MNEAHDFEELVSKSLDDPGWDFANQILYKLCKDYPGHNEEDKNIAKIWLIGRSYAAAIERGRTSGGASEDFYVDVVGPALRNSEIDDLISGLKGIELKENTLQTIIDAHGKLTQIFSKKVSGLENRSLASKYLHFHLPELFFIYDERARKGISQIKKLSGKASKKFSGGDKDYRCFAEKCLNLRNKIGRVEGRKSGGGKKLLNPRQLDNLLLAVVNKSFVIQE